MPEAAKLGRIVIAGGSGFLGVSLAYHLARLGAEIAILSRHAPKPKGPWRFVEWDARKLGAWSHELEGAKALVNLVGRTVDCIKTPAHQDEILRSRVESTCVLGKAMRGLNSAPPVWVQMSTAHIYGDPPSALCTEESAFGIGLAPVVGQAWENAHQESLLPSQRSVVVRTSFVLGRNQGAGGGAFQRLRLLTRLGLGGRIGGGMQGISWLHETDMNRIFERAITDPNMRGPYIASSPNPVPQHEFAKQLRRALHVPTGLPATAWMVRIGAPLFLRTDPDLALYGRYVIPQRLIDENFTFQFAHLSDALRDITTPKSLGNSISAQELNGA